RAFSILWHRSCFDLCTPVLHRIKVVSPSFGCEFLGNIDGRLVFLDCAAPYLPSQVSLLFSQPLVVARSVACILPGTAGMPSRSSALCNFSAHFGWIRGCHQPLHRPPNSAGDGSSARQLALERQADAATVC